MKKIFTLLLSLFIVYFAVQIVFNYFSKGYSVNYKIQSNADEFEVSEKYIANMKDEEDNYYIEIKKGDTIFSLQVFDNFLKKKKIVESIKYYSDSEYECIYPTFINNKIIYEVICQKDNIIYNYSTMNKVDGINKFVKGIINYDYSRWQSDENTTKQKNQITTFTGNLSKDTFLAISNYKGTYTINLKTNMMDLINSVNVFDSDVYKYPISAFVDKYYVVADYKDIQIFSTFNLVDITTNEVTKIYSDHYLSFNSFVLGTYDKSIYLYDPNTKKEYEVDTSAKTVLEVGNEKTKIKIYENGKWDKREVSEITDKTRFSNYLVTIDANNLIVKTGGDKSGFIYTLEPQKVGYKYKVYRSNVQNLEQKTYLFDVDSFNDMLFVKDYIFFKNGNDIKSYSTKTGLKLLYNDSELEFNQYIKFGAYIK